MSEFETFLNEIATRFTGPLQFRFVVQPICAILLGIRDGRMDAKACSLPYVINFYVQREQRWQLLKSALISILKPIIIGIIMDGIAQYLIFQTIRPFQAFLVGSLVIAIPYVFARGLSNRFFYSKKYM